MVCCCTLVGVVFLLILVVLYFIYFKSFSSLIKSIQLYLSTGKFFVSLFRVDEECRRNGGQVVADVLKAHGVKQVFTLCGGHISPILVGCEANGIRVVDTRHEVTTVFAADAVARLSQTIGVAAVTAGPGVTNTITAIKNAQIAESPVLLLGGAAPSLLKGRGALQDIDQMVLLRPLCKYCATIRRVQDIPKILMEAIAVAQSGTPGPVFVEFPIDCLYPYQTVLRESGISPNPKSFVQRLVNTFITYRVCQLFGDGFKNTNFSPLPVHVDYASDDQVQRAFELLSQCKKPLILFGSQSTLPPVKPDQLKSSVEALGIPCYLGGMSRGLLGRNSSLQMRHRRKEALKDADLVILAGAVCDFRLSYGRNLNRKSKIISINRNRENMLKNSDMFWKPVLAVNGDVADFIVRLSQMARSSKYQPDIDWLKDLKNRDNEKDEQIKKEAETIPQNHLNPLKVLLNLENILPDDAVLVADGGDFVGSAAYTLKPRGPLHWLDPGAFGTLGVGAGFALGAKIVWPHRPIWVIFGDGAFGYSVSEFDTFVRHDLPVVSVIGNDACWSQISREQVPMFGSSVGCMLSFTNYHNVVEGFGAAGLLLDLENASKIQEVFKEADKLNRTHQRSVVVNVLIGKSSFREGSISV